MGGEGGRSSINTGSRLLGLRIHSLGQQRTKVVLKNLLRLFVFILNEPRIVDDLVV
jgi:hypothetical protein